MPLPNTVESGDGGPSGLDGGDASDAGVVPTETDPQESFDGGLDAAVAPAETGSPCALTTREVGLMGDSYLARESVLTQSLEQRARAAGTLRPYEVYRNRARTGATMAGASPVPDQLAGLIEDTRRAGGTLDLVVMNGGGNDVLVDNRRCLDLRDARDSVCMGVVTRSVEAMTSTFAAMREAGIEHVIFVGYPNLPGGGLGGRSPEVMNDYAMPRMAEACEQSEDVTCLFVDARPTFAGRSDYFGVDRIHPNERGASALADLVWSAMQDVCPGAK